MVNWPKLIRALLGQPEPVDPNDFIGFKYPVFDADGKIYQGMIFKEDDSE